ncbi:MAG: Fe-S cluster assembly protein SufD [Pseudomonadales bacterium]
MSWLASTISQAEQTSDWLSEKRQQSLALLRETPWPSKRTEAWKYTPINTVERAKFEAVEAAAIPPLTSIEGLESLDLYFVDGQLQTQCSTLQLPEGLTIKPLAQGAELSWAREQFANIKPNKHFFGLVNDTLATQGCVIEVEADASIDQPIRLVQHFSSQSQAHLRVLVKLNSGAKACIIEQFSGDALSLNTSFAEYDIATQAHLEHYRLALQTQEAISVGGCHFNLAEKAKLISNLIGFGSQLSRVDMDIIHAGEHAYSKLNVIYLLDHRELFDLHSCIEHTKAHGVSEENVRCIVADRANAVFNGRIHIHRDAQKILAEMNNRNLLMSDNAQINTKPELEIYADDVRCAHGATIAEIDEEAMFYLRSRGISRSDAQVLLSFGFINELVDQMDNQALAQWLRPQLRERFAKMELV